MISTCQTLLHESSSKLMKEMGGNMSCKTLHRPKRVLKLSTKVQHHQLKGSLTHTSYSRHKKPCFNCQVLNLRQLRQKKQRLKHHQQVRDQEWLLLPFVHIAQLAEKMHTNCRFLQRTHQNCKEAITSHFLTKLSLVTTIICPQTIHNCKIMFCQQQLANTDNCCKP